MDVGQEYAIAIGGSFGVLLFINNLPIIVHFIQYLSLVITKHLIYRYILHRHRFLGPWSLAGVLVHLIYIAGNICCLEFWNTSLSKAGLRAGTLAVINLMPLLAGNHLSALADATGMSLNTFRQIHQSLGAMTVGLAVFHALVRIASELTFPLDLAQNLFAVIGSSSLVAIILFSLPLFRKPSYEFFLRSHQALAALAAYSIWRHIPSEKVFPRMYLYISAGLFLTVLAFQSLLICKRNGIFRYNWARAYVTYEHGAVRVRIRLHKQLYVKEGQFINLWMPFISMLSFLQTHPFVVISWAEKPQDYLDLFIEPKRGLTRTLLYYAKQEHTVGLLVFFSGPHGRSVSVDNHENILMVASGFGIAAQLPYLKRLIHGYNAREIRARRVHLIWQVSLEVATAAQPFLNGALTEDTLDNGWILAISIYCEVEGSFGKRVKVYPFKAPLRELLQAEVLGQHLKEKEVKDIHETILKGKLEPGQQGRGDTSVVSQKTSIDWDTETLVEGNLESGNPRRMNRNLLIVRRQKEKRLGENIDTKTIIQENLESGNQLRRDGKLLVIVSAINDMRDELRSTVQEYLTSGVSFFELDYQPQQK